MKGFIGALLLALIYLYVVSFQRELILVAISDVTFYDGIDRSNVPFELPAGGSASIARCRERNGVIEPAIELRDGRLAYLVSGHFKIDSKPTGLLSRPRYLGCPGY